MMTQRSPDGDSPRMPDDVDSLTPYDAPEMPNDVDRVIPVAGAPMTPGVVSPMIPGDIAPRGG